LVGSGDRGWIAESGREIFVEFLQFVAGQNNKTSIGQRLGVCPVVNRRKVELAPKGSCVGVDLEDVKSIPREREIKSNFFVVVERADDLLVIEKGHCGRGQEHLGDAKPLLEVRILGEISGPEESGPLSANMEGADEKETSRRLKSEPSGRHRWHLTLSVSSLLLNSLSVD
jgi:hypothetical protein